MSIFWGVISIKMLIGSGWYSGLNQILKTDTKQTVSM